MDVADDLLSGAPVEDKPEVQLVGEEGGPWIGTGTAEEDEVVVGFEIGELNAPRRARIDGFRAALRQGANSYRNRRVDSGCRVVAPQNGVAKAQLVRRELIRFGNVFAIGVIGDGNLASGDLP